MGQENSASEKDAGAIFVFNYDLTLKMQFNPQRYFCYSLLKSFCPKADDCPANVRAAFYELLVGPIDWTNWETLESFTRWGKHYVRPGVSKSEDDFVTSKNTSQLGFTPYIVAVWSNLVSVFFHIHDRLVQNITDGYVGCTILEIPGTIEEFHTMCRKIDLGFDAIVKDGKYLYPRGSDHPLKTEVMLEMGFGPTQS